MLGEIRSWFSLTRNLAPLPDYRGARGAFFLTPHLRRLGHQEDGRQGNCEGLSIITMMLLLVLLFYRIALHLQSLRSSLSQCSLYSTFYVSIYPQRNAFYGINFFSLSIDNEILKNFQRHNWTNIKCLSNPGLLYNVDFLEFTFIRKFLGIKKSKTIKYSYMHEFYLEENSSKI